MLFNSLHFLLFFPLVTFLYFILPHKYRWALLLLASCYFYMAFIPVYILILAFTIVVDYAAGLLIEKSEGRKRKTLLVLSLVSNIGVLAFFKYFNFLNENISHLLGFFGTSNPVPYLGLILPIGLSFHTFQAMSYTIEVYRGKQKAEKHFGIYALYVMFYPQLVAGPIERPQNLIHQFYEKHEFDYNRVKDGLKLMAWGMFKKVVIADRLALLVNPVYDAPQQHHGLTLILATFFFAFQIYCDFSGYSDIAVGSAQCMGFRLMSNFNRPYFSKSIAGFWNRWHISLSTWFKDYVYIPLGGSHVPRGRLYYNLLITFLISGLWHGASWTFLAWGMLHAMYMITGHLTRPIREKLVRKAGLEDNSLINRWGNALVTFSLVSFAWIFFRARSMGDALYIIKHLSDGLHEKIRPALEEILAHLNKTELLIAVFSILLLELVHAIQRHNGIKHLLSERPAAVRWAIYNLIVLSILYFGIFNRTEFIYFQF